MTRRPGLPLLSLLALLACSLLAAGQAASVASAPGAAYAQNSNARGDQKIGEEAARQIGALAAEKRARTAAQKKIDSQLLYALKQKRGETRGVPVGRIDLQLDAEGRTLVDITCTASALVVARVKELCGNVVSVSDKYHTVRAWLALEKLEALAGLKDVRYISPPAQAMTHGGAKNN